MSGTSTVTTSATTTRSGSMTSTLTSTATPTLSGSRTSTFTSTASLSRSTTATSSPTSSASATASTTMSSTVTTIVTSSAVSSVTTSATTTGTTTASSTATTTLSASGSTTPTTTATTTGTTTSSTTTTTTDPTIVHLNCSAGFHSNRRGKSCAQCTSGTFAANHSVREFCPGRCATGYTSKAGATSADDCFLAYRLMSHSQQHTTCQGSFDTNGDGWRNQGYMYVTTAEECEFAAGLLQKELIHGVNTHTLSERCVNTFTATDEFGNLATQAAAEANKRCSGRIQNEPQWCADSGNGVHAWAGTTLHCNKACSCVPRTRAAGPQHDSTAYCPPGAAPDKAPQGYCVLENDASTKAQFLSLYDSCATQFYDGKNYTAICKVQSLFRCCCTFSTFLLGRGKVFLAAAVVVVVAGLG